jgi:hypothetical protein
MPPLYTLTDHSEAKAKLEALNAKWKNYSGNNPNKFQADIAVARAELHSIEVELKKTGELAQTPIEKRNALLDEAFPDAKSRQVVDWQGKKYIRRFSPVSTSLSGKTVKEWHKYWEDVAE